MDFYQSFLRLCADRTISPSKAALEMGFSKSTVSHWKAGGGVTDTTMRKVAAYFDVPLSYFIETSVGYVPTPAPKSPADEEQLFTAATDEQKIEWAARLISSLSDNQQAALIQRIMFKK